MGTNELSYTLIRSSRKTTSIQVMPDGEVVVRCPRRLPAAQVRSFVESKRNWIENHRAKLTARPPLPPLSAREIRELAQQAAEVLPQRAAHFAAIMGVTYGRITIRSQHTRWGSCSAKGNLNFNCLLMLVPPQVRDYVVVHELCHRREMNHSAAFWAEVEKICPDYRIHKQWLKENGGALIGRLPK